MKLLLFAFILSGCAVVHYEHLRTDEWTCGASAPRQVTETDTWAHASFIKTTIRNECVRWDHKP